MKQQIGSQIESEKVSDQSTRMDRREFIGFAAATAAMLSSRARAVENVTNVAAGAASLTSVFANPPINAGPGAYWYWLGGNVTREGITADLEAMREAGISLPMMFSIGGASGKDALVSPPAVALSDTWWKLIEHAANEAERLGMQLAMNICDGWATASGPWITPELSMQQVTWSTLTVDGGRLFTNVVPTPPAKLDYYRDVATIAFRVGTDWGDTSFSRRAGVRSNLPLKITDAVLLTDPSNMAEVMDTEQGGWIEYAFDKPFTLRSVTVRTPSPCGFSPGVYRAANSLEVQASDDGKSFRRIGALEYPKHGWQTDLTTLTHAIPETTARYFRLVHTPLEAGEYREEYDFAQDTRLRFFSIVLASEPRIHHLQGKSGAQWGVSRRMTAQDVPDAACVKVGDIVDLTSKLRSDGGLQWHVPPGRWRVLRIGYTTTGSHNSAAGGAQGLECDRFNPEAARLQFESWFATALQRLGPRIAGKVLHTVHVDSWEAGAQNWAPGFRDAFRSLRNYDILPYLAVMAGVPVESAEASERVLFDVRRTINELTQRNFFAVIAKLAHERGCAVSAEPASPTYSVDGLEHIRHVDVPMGEFWLDTPRNDKPNDVKDAVSGGRIYGRRVIAAEAFTQGRMNWGEHPFKLKALGDRMFCEGINRFMLHVYAQQPWVDRAPGMTLNGIGAFFSRTQTWWKPGKAWFDYLRRCQALLQEGMAVADVCYFIGEDIPSRALLPRQLSVPLPSGYSYDSINRDALLNLASVVDGDIVLQSGMRYRALVLGDQEMMSPELAARLRDLARDGATIIGPQHGTPLGEVLQSLGAPPDVTFDAGEDIRWIHRRGEGWDLYFLSNQSMQSRSVEARFRVSGREPELWMADTGKITAPESWREHEGGTNVSLTLDPAGSMFVVFARPAQRERRGSLPPRRQVGTIAIDHAWTVQFEARSSIQQARFDTLRSWTTHSDPNIKYFSGSAVYIQQLSIDKQWLDRGQELLLDLGEVHDLVQVVLNGQDLGVLWKPPFVIDIASAARRGKNTLELRVTNTWRNRIIGDHGKPEAERQSFIVPMLRKGQSWLPSSDDQLLPAGLLGPVRIQLMKR